MSDKPSGYWAGEMSNSRRRAGCITWLVEHYREEVETILIGDWPEGTVPPKQPKPLPMPAKGKGKKGK